MFPRPPNRALQGTSFFIGHQGYPGAFCHMGAWCKAA